MLGKLLFQYLKAYRWLLLGVLVFQFASAMASLYLPRLNANIIDEGVSKGDTAYIWSTGTLMLGISLLQITTSIIATYFAARAAMAAGRDIRRDVYGKVSGFSEREVSKFGPGSLITRNTNDVQQVQMLAMMGATMLVTAPLLAIGGIIMALQQDVGLSWLIAVAVPAPARGRRHHHQPHGAAVPRVPDQARRRQPHHARAAHRCPRGPRLRARGHRRGALPRRQHRHHGRRPQGRLAVRAAVPARDARAQRHRRRRDLVRRHPGRRRHDRDRHALRLHAVRRSDPHGRADGELHDDHDPARRGVGRAHRRGARERVHAHPARERRRRVPRARIAELRGRRVHLPRRRGAGAARASASRPAAARPSPSSARPARARRRSSR